MNESFRKLLELEAEKTGNNSSKLSSIWREICEGEEIDCFENIATLSRIKELMLFGFSSLICRENPSHNHSIIENEFLCQDKSTDLGKLDVKFDCVNWPLKGEVLKTLIKGFGGEVNHMLRYLLMPIAIANPSPTFCKSGGTCLVGNQHLAQKVGVLKENLLFKLEGENRISGSYKDRVTATAISAVEDLIHWNSLPKALQNTNSRDIIRIGCASTGNLAIATLEHAKRCGFKAQVFVPDNLGEEKYSEMRDALLLDNGAPNGEIIRAGNFDEINIMLSQLYDSYPWLLTANINLRPRYKTGAKTLLYEIAEQMNWDLPPVINVVMALAGGTSSSSVVEAFDELKDLDLINKNVQLKLWLVQPEGCDTVASSAINKDFKPKFVKNPMSIADSLLIGYPGDAEVPLKFAIENGGGGCLLNDREIEEGTNEFNNCNVSIRKTEHAGGLEWGGAKKLILSGEIPRKETTIVVITGSERCKSLDSSYTELAFGEYKIKGIQDYKDLMEKLKSDFYATH